ncbi:hypothetical protein RRG08_053030 [Elysia crispata]|uniref:Uncharacterized protein n=1 Tax=Elysia crispata TaxID=231223 RepID=A0AAE0Y534_9GAST|nr:hypothetical protein RRG08_053030 [Elysia crispata]
MVALGIVSSSTHRIILGISGRQGRAAKEVEPHDEKIAFCLKLQYIVEFKPHTCMIIKRSVPSSGRFGDQPVHLVLSLIPDDQMTSTPHTVSYSPSNSEGRLSIGTDDANVPRSVQFSPTDESSSVQFSPPAPAAGESRVVSNTRDKTGKHYGAN